MRNSVLSLFFSVFALLLFNGCASTKVIESSVGSNSKGKTISNVLIIGMASDENNRRLFEKTFVRELKAVGVSAVSSANVIPIPADQKLEKEMIEEALDKYNNDTVLVTHIVGIDKKTSYKPAVYSVGTGYYGYYRYYYGHQIRPSSVSLHTKLGLETKLYDVKSEELIWSCQSQTWETESVKQIIDGVIKVVIKDMKKNNLFPKK